MTTLAIMKARISLLCGPASLHIAPFRRVVKALVRGTDARLRFLGMRTSPEVKPWEEGWKCPL